MFSSVIFNLNSRQKYLITLKSYFNLKQKVKIEAVF